MVQLPAKTLPGLDEVHAWHIPLPSTVSQTLADDLWILSPEEQNRGECFVAEIDSVHFVASHLWLRRIVGNYLAVAPEDLRFLADKDGKPHLDMPGAPALQFNLSHTKGRALLAVTSTTQVGADIERISSVPELDAIAESYFTESERRQIFAAADHTAAVRIFFRLWTAKEALLKAIGKGLLLPLQEVEIDCNARLGTAVRAMPALAGNAEAWRLFCPRAPEEYVAAIAATGEVQTMVELLCGGRELECTPLD